MLLTTTPNIEDKKIVEYLGLVTGEVIMGTNPIKDIAASLRELVGSRSKEYEESLIAARKEALKELEERAIAMGADAVISINLDFEQVSQHNMIMVCATGTAVKYQ